MKLFLILIAIVFLPSQAKADNTAEDYREYYQI